MQLRIIISLQRETANSSSHNTPPISGVPSTPSRETASNEPLLLSRELRSLPWSLLILPDPWHPPFADTPYQVMELLEAKVGSVAFLRVLTEVNREISRKRTERRQKKAVEKVTDPVATAERRRERAEASKVKH